MRIAWNESAKSAKIENSLNEMSRLRTLYLIKQQCRKVEVHIWDLAIFNSQ